ncbi:hypothetical protein PVW47_14045 [Marinovum sp. SP66]|uniref:hypothetical protein n=1 Tax=Marinovum TaxID=367771 RepID=UPI00237A2459|nr:hypothetical protein [Marinovum sp. SP66]MDD9740897.1 hypothetical protein [Marinovum sp. SP66]
MNDLLTTFEPQILEILGMIITVLIGLAAAQFRRWTGIEIEARHREALHSAIITGVKRAMRHGPDRAVQEWRDAAVTYAKASVPDAIRKLVPGDGILDSLAERYVLEQMERVGLGRPDEPVL